MSDRSLNKHSENHRTLCLHACVSYAHFTMHIVQLVNYKLEGHPSPVRSFTTLAFLRFFSSYSSLVHSSTPASVEALFLDHRNAWLLNPQPAVPTQRIPTPSYSPTSQNLASQFPLLGVLSPRTLTLQLRQPLRYSCQSPSDTHLSPPWAILNTLKAWSGTWPCASNHLGTPPLPTAVATTRLHWRLLVMRLSP